MKRLALKVVLTVLVFTLLIPLWLSGMRIMTLEIQEGKIPLQTVAEAFGIAPWFPLVLSIIFILGFQVFLLHTYLHRRIR